MLDEQAIAEEVNELCNDFFKKLILFKEIQFEIKPIRILQEDDGYRDQSRKIVQITIGTNARPLLLGQVRPLQLGGLLGFYSNLLRGYLYGYFRGKYGIRLSDSYSLEFDIQDYGRGSQDVYRYLTVEEAKSFGFLSPSSAASLYFAKYGIDRILIAGTVVSSPSLAMMKTVEQICAEQSINNAIDYFSGTGALARVMIANGVKKVTCIDDSLMSDTMAQQAITIIKKDAFDFVPEDKVDLIVLDPFYYQSKQVAEQLVPRLKGKSRLLVLDISNKSQRFWIEQVTKVLKLQFDSVELHCLYNACLAICKNWRHLQ